MPDKLSLNKGIESKLNTIPKVNGSMTFTEDGQNCYIDFRTISGNVNRVKITDIIFLANDSNRSTITNPQQNKFYYVQGTKTIWNYTSKWLKVCKFDIDYYISTAEFSLVSGSNDTLATITKTSISSWSDDNSQLGSIIIDKNNSFGIITSLNGSLLLNVRVLNDNSYDNTLKNIDIYIDSNYTGTQEVGTFKKPFKTWLKMETDCATILSNATYRCTVHLKSGTTISKSDATLNISGWNNVNFVSDGYLTNTFLSIANVKIINSSIINFRNIQINTNSVQIDGSNVILDKTLVSLNNTNVTINNSTLLTLDTEFRASKFYFSGNSYSTFKNSKNIVIEQINQTAGSLILDNCTNVNIVNNSVTNAADLFIFNDTEISRNLSNIQIKYETLGNVMLEGGYLSTTLSGIYGTINIKAVKIDLGQFDFKGVIPTLTGTVNQTSGLNSDEVYDLVSRYYGNLNPTLKSHLDAIGNKFDDIYNVQLPSKVAKAAMRDPANITDYTMVKNVNYRIDPTTHKLELVVTKKDVNNDNHTTNNSTSYITLPGANTFDDGVMTKESYEALRLAIMDIENIKNQGGHFIGFSFNTVADLMAWTNPNKIPIDNGDFTYVLFDENHLDDNGDPQVCKYVWSVLNPNNETNIKGLFVTIGDPTYSDCTGYYENKGVNTTNTSTTPMGTAYGSYYKLKDSARYLYRVNYPTGGTPTGKYWQLSDGLSKGVGQEFFNKLDTSSNISDIYYSHSWYKTSVGIKDIAVEPDYKDAAFSWQFAFIIQETPIGIASSTKSGIVKLVSDLKLNTAPVPAVTSGSANKVYPIQLNEDNKMVVNVPWPSVPEKPKILRVPSYTPLGVEERIKITIDPTTFDSNYTYTWDGRLGDDISNGPGGAGELYPPGRQVVTLTAEYMGLTATAAEVFFVGNTNVDGGGAPLAGQVYNTLEPGIPGFLIRGFEFSVGPMTGHNGGQDRFLVFGHNMDSDEWVRILGDPVGKTEEILAGTLNFGTSGPFRTGSNSNGGSCTCNCYGTTFAHTGGCTGIGYQRAGHVWGVLEDTKPGIYGGRLLTTSTINDRAGIGGWPIYKPALGIYEFETAGIPSGYNEQTGSITQGRYDQLRFFFYTSHPSCLVQTAVIRYNIELEYIDSSTVSGGVSRVSIGGGALSTTSPYLPGTDPITSIGTIYHLETDGYKHVPSTKVNINHETINNENKILRVAPGDSTIVGNEGQFSWETLGSTPLGEINTTSITTPLTVNDTLSEALRKLENKESEIPSGLFAPAGYGLGESYITMYDDPLDDCNNAFKNGWYYCNNATLNKPIGSVVGTMFVTSGDLVNASVQYFYSETKSSLPGISAGTAKKWDVYIRYNVSGEYGYTPWRLQDLEYTIETGSDGTLGPLNNIMQANMTIFANPGNTANNYPSNDAYIVQHLVGGSRVVQIARCLTTNISYTRTYNGSIWSSWKELGANEPEYIIGRAFNALPANELVITNASGTVQRVSPAGAIITPGNFILGVTKEAYTSSFSQVKVYSKGKLINNITIDGPLLSGADVYLEVTLNANTGNFVSTGTFFQGISAFTKKSFIKIGYLVSTGVIYLDPGNDIITSDSSNNRVFDRPTIIRSRTAFNQARMEYNDSEDCIDIIFS